MNSTLNKTPSIEERLRKLLAEARKAQLEHEKAMEDMVMRSAEKSKSLSAALESLFGWTEPEDQLSETAFATILSPLETLDVKKVVSKGDNIVVSDYELARADQKLAVPLQEPEILLNSFSLGGGDALLDSGKDKAPTKEELAVDSFPDPEILRNSLSLGGGGALGSGEDEAFHGASVTELSPLETLDVKAVASKGNNSAVSADGFSRGSVGAMKHMHDRWKWRWKLPVLLN